MLLPLAGCGASGVDDALTVATAWPAAERARWEGLFRQASAAPGTVRWLVLAPGGDVTRLASRREPPDLILGGPASAYENLARRGLLEPDENGKPAWRVARRAAIGFASSVRSKGHVGTPENDVPGADRPLTFDDPRRDPVALAWAKTVLDSGDWADGFARIVRSVRGVRPPGRQPGAALAAVERGEAETTPAVAPFGSEADRPAVRFAAAPGPPSWIEGMAVVRGSRRATDAQALLDGLTEQGRVEWPKAGDVNDPAADALLADLLGAALVDAGDELRAAWSVLGKGSSPSRMERWMTEAPPWPPASVAKILQSGVNAMPLGETLAAQVAPDADVRAWLLRSWLAPPRSVDGALLHDLAGAVDGRLVREPRFRAWLRGEWTAWARQRYRRVARQVRAGQGLSAEAPDGDAAPGRVNGADLSAARGRVE